MKKPHRILRIVLLIAVLIGIGYTREYLFKTINALLKARDFQIEYATGPGLHFLEGYTASQLIFTKWLLTILFSVIYLAITAVFIRVYFQAKRYDRLIVTSYALLLVSSGICMLFAFVAAGSTADGYPAARYLMGIAQSPIPLMILLPTLKLYELQAPNLRRKS